MNFISVSLNDGIATVKLDRGKVNALNEPLIEQLHGCFADIETNRDVRAVILTGQGKFFSFGFDIPEFLSYPKESFTGYLAKFTGLYTSMFLFSKPVVAALNGHTIAGGCMIALACDTRVMVSEKAKISLNEINFGSSVFAGSVEMLKFCVGRKNAETILYSGAMYSAEEALRLGLIDRISSPEELMDDAGKAARELAGKDLAAFKSLKGLLRRPVAEEMVNREKDSIREFVDIWYSEKTRRNLEEIKIYS